MKFVRHTLTTLATAFALGAAALPAFAGPDWQAIEHGRKLHSERLQAQPVASAEASGASSPAASAANAHPCAVEPLVLPLDHGPRAQTTPYLNHLRQERNDAQVQACKVAMK
jgi:hypothetical protein